MAARTRLLSLGFLAATLTSAAAAQSLRPSRLVGDHMVMQRGRAVPVWGWAAPGTRVTIVFDGRPRVATTDSTGAWSVTLPAMPAGGPHEMSIVAGSERRDVHDILVGDVWVCSGQSNMEFVVADAEGGAEAVASAHDARIRHFKVPNSYAEQPEAELAGGEWEVADPGHVGDFTAVGWFFAEALRQSVNVPIGLLNVSWGGSRIEPWMSREALGLDSAAWTTMMQRERDYEQRTRDSLRARLGELPSVDSGLVDGRAAWADPALADSAWRTLDATRLWEQQGYDGLDGVAWYRTTFSLSPDEAARGVRLGLGMIDDSDVSWVNGVEVGSTLHAWNRPREYDVPPRALRAGPNTIAVRVQDDGGGGGIYGDSALLFVESSGVRRPLPTRWRFRVGAVAPIPDGQHINRIPTLLYNRMIHPIQRFPIAGVLWYQGESNADSVADAVAYRPLFQQLIGSWRSQWRQGDFPFLWVQLANYMEPGTRPSWALLRESQSAALRLPRTGQAVIIDIGATDDIHPRNKRDVGRRLALAARRVAYGQSLVFSGPTYRRSTTRGNRVTLDFAHVGGGLTTRAGRPLGGFVIAGADRRFVPAQARLEGNRVVVWSDDVPHPVAVRYAWDNNPLDATLVNREGLPASPFRTDDW